MKIINKGWGCEKIIHNGDGYCGKILCFDEGKKCSYHYHKIKTETFYCKGKILLIYGDDDKIENAKKIILENEDVFHIPAGVRHQMIALEKTELFEFSSTHIDSDSYRVLPGD